MENQLESEVMFVRSDVSRTLLFDGCKSYFTDKNYKIYRTNKQKKKKVVRMPDFKFTELSDFPE